PGYRLALLSSGVIGLVLHLAMIAAAVGLLMLRAWGWWLSVAWATLQFVYQALSLAYLWVVALPAANRVVQTVPRDDNGVCGPIANGNPFYHVFWGLFALGFSFYPLLVLVLLVLPPVRRAFGRGNSRGHEDQEERRSRRRADEREEEGRCEQLGRPHRSA